MDGYCRRMRHLAEYCEFQDNDREIKSQIIQGCESARLQTSFPRTGHDFGDIVRYR